MTPATTDNAEARKIIREALTPFGYDLPYLRFGWQIPNAYEVRQYTSQDEGKLDKFPTGKVRVLDALAFADPKRQDWNTTAIAIDLGRVHAVGTEASRKQAKDLFSLTAAPTNLIGSAARKKVDIWFNCHDGMIGSEDVDFNPDALQSVFRRHRSSVQRDLLAQLRAGQHHLFDGQLLARRNELAGFLQRGVSKATWIVRKLKWGADKREGVSNREAFSRAALALLAARILEDKGALGEGREQTTDARTLLSDARTKWDSFFNAVVDDDLPRLEKQFAHTNVDLMLKCLLSHLTGPINFSLVTHEMLGDLYERALVAERSVGSDRFIKLQGVHYTPLTITKRILDRIPLEKLPPEERTVCDFACGSGSFLLAATDRLDKLFDPREPTVTLERTAWLSRAVMGNDIDPVATLVTQLSYLVAYWNRVDETHGVPYPDLHEKGDALAIDLLAAFGRVPTVIVGNPPFDLKGHKASQFLERALDVLLAAPRLRPGYIGMVMPGAFLKGKRDQKAVRNKLLQHARILDIWELPEHAIGLCAEAPTCVVIAEVTGTAPPPYQPVRICQMISRRLSAIATLRDQGVTTWSYVAELRPDHGAGSDDQAYALAFSPDDDIWSRLSKGGVALSTIAKVVWGFTHAKAQGNPDPEFSSVPGPDLVPYIRQQSALRPYTFTEQDWRNSHDDDQRYWKRGTGPRTYKSNWSNYESPKILIPARSNRNTLSQLVAALDFGKYYPGKDFLALTLHKSWQTAFKKAYPSPFAVASMEDVLRWVCAILNSVIGHAWFGKHAGPRGLQRDVCQIMPLPTTYDPRIALQVALLEGLPRPRNLGTNPTWNPESGLVTPTVNLFEAGAVDDEQDNEYWRAVATINRLVLDSYGLGPSDRKRITTFITGMMEPWIDNSPDAAKLKGTIPLRVIQGKTHSTDSRTQTMTAAFMWKPLGNGKPITVPIPKYMPGWALRDGCEFTCRVPADCTLGRLKSEPWLLREFEPIPYSYLDSDQLEKMVGFQTGVVSP